MIDINWYVIPFLWDDGIIQQLTMESELYYDLAKKEQHYRDRLSHKMTTITGLSADIDRLELENNTLRKITNNENTDVDVNMNRITAGRYTQDKPSHHSPLTFRQMQGIAKNVIVISKDLYVVKLSGDTNSQEPDIDDNSLLIIHKYHKEKYEILKEDLVHYIHPRATSRLVHRVTKVDHRRKDPYYIQGDNNQYGDGWATKEQILGIVCGQFWGEEPDDESDD